MQRAIPPIDLQAYVRCGSTLMLFNNGGDWYMNDEISQFIGIDVSKDSLSIFVWGQQGTSLEIKNTEQAISN